MAKRKFLISGYYGFDNFGDEAILKVLLDKLKDCEVTVLTANPRKTFDTYGVHTVYTFSLEHVLKEVARCDVLISGGGSLLQNVTSNQSLMFYTSILKFAQMMRKEIIIFAQGIGPIKGFFLSNWTKGILKKANYISVRDEKSLEFLKKWKIKNANLVCDPVYSLEVTQPERTNKIGIQLRTFETLTDELFDNIAKNIRMRFYNREVELISLQDEKDVGISQVFYNKMKHADPNFNIKIVKGLNNNEIIDHISQYDCMIGMRFHACLVALKYGVKTMAIAYDPKVETLAKEYGIPYLSMKSKDNNYEKAFNDMENLSRWNLMEQAKSHKFDWDKTGINEAKKEKRIKRTDAVRNKK